MRTGLLLVIFSLSGCTFDDAGFADRKCAPNGAIEPGTERECIDGFWVEPVPTTTPVEDMDASGEVEVVDPCAACTEKELCCEVDGAQTCIASDDANCGACGNVCPGGTVCSDGACTCPVGLTSCALESDTCDVDLLVDPTNCGACGTTCTNDELCSGGTCVCADSICVEGEACCGDACVDSAVRTDHCGTCGNTCPPGERCAAGECACPGQGTSCDEGTRCCPEGCVDVASPCLCGGAEGRECTTEELCCSDACVPNDAANCGACGVTCRADQVCVGDSCTCPAGTTPCGDACVDPSNDPANCGACGVTCGADAVCCNGACTGVGTPLGSALGDPVYTGSTSGRPNDYTGSCGRTDNSPDQAFSWTAPDADCYEIGTYGSSYDTVLHIRYLCSGEQIVCDDDDGFSLRQSVELDLPAGLELLIIVDGYDGRSGNFELDIERCN